MIEQYLTETQIEGLKKMINVNVDINKLDDFVAWLTTKYLVTKVIPWVDAFNDKRLAFIEIDVDCKNERDVDKKIKKEMKKAGFADLINLIYVVCD